jgi:hypothetical protein
MGRKEIFLPIVFYSICRCEGAKRLKQSHSRWGAFDGNDGEIAALPSVARNDALEGTAYNR